jgi:hypothetical protein
MAMRKILATVLLAAVLTGAGSTTASAGQKGQNQFFYGSWRSHHRVDSTTVDREYWYFDAYSSGDRISAFAYHVTYRCTTIDGKQQCKRHGAEYGRARGLTPDQFTIDKKVTGMHLAATFRLRSKNGSVMVADVTIDLIGVGPITRAKESYSYRTGCELYKFNGHTRYRDADGVPSISIGGVAQSVGAERYAQIGFGDSVTITKEC